MKTFNIITELEQFQQQCPELYAVIIAEGMEKERLEQQEVCPDCGVDCKGACFEDQFPMDDDDRYDPAYDHPQYATPIDKSERFNEWGSWADIYARAQELEKGGYKAGNRPDWREFMDIHKTGIRGESQTMYIAWNPTHKEFAVESNDDVINERYNNLVPFDGDDDLPF